MNFNIQKFRDKYIKIKHDIKVGIKKNKLTSGSGGSNNLIILNFKRNNVWNKSGYL